MQKYNTDFIYRLWHRVLSFWGLYYKKNQCRRFQLPKHFLNFMIAIQRIICLKPPLPTIPLTVSVVTLFSKGTYFSFTVLQCTRGICQSLSCKIINYGYMYKKYLKIMSTTHTSQPTCLHVRHYCWIGPF